MDPAPPFAPRTPPAGRSLRGTALAVSLVWAVGAAVLVQFGSGLAYAPARSVAIANEEELRSAVDAQRRAADRGEATSVQAAALRAALVGELADPAAVAALDTAIGSLDEALDLPAPVAPITGAHPPDEPTVPAWDRLAALVELSAELPLVRERTIAFDATATLLADADSAVDDASSEVFTAAVGRAQAALDATPNASTRTRLDLQYAVDVTAEAGDAAAFAALADAVVAARDAQAAEEAHRRDEPRRAEIEAFARSLSNGVALDFTWSYEAAGVSSDGYYAGTAQFWPEGGGWGLITLTFSVADNWDDENARAVVVHEVGHTQVIRDACHAQFTGPAFAGDHEAWATAWAIGMGYDLPGSGIEAYGRPSDEQIAVAATCR
ncbi:hypothetical protein ACGGZK_16945 [Agromyces sp. MMS24-K17]|uniref:hypothetical protein n=1 Tax=Agromyces sp. MMS24-K17 TaxID=3372850 RepID=UPI003754EE47